MVIRRSDLPPNHHLRGSYTDVGASAWIKHEGFVHADYGVFAARGQVGRWASPSVWSFGGEGFAHANYRIFAAQE